MEYLDLIVSLYWWNGSEWIAQQGSQESHTEEPPWDIGPLSATHSCASGQTHDWMEVSTMGLIDEGVYEGNYYEAPANITCA